MRTNFIANRSMRFYDSFDGAHWCVSRLSEAHKVHLSCERVANFASRFFESEFICFHRDGYSLTLPNYVNKCGSSLKRWFIRVEYHEPHLENPPVVFIRRSDLSSDDIPF